MFLASCQVRVQYKLQVLCPIGSKSITNCLSMLYRAKTWTLVIFMTWKIFFASRRGRVHPNFMSFVPMVQLTLPTAFQVFTETKPSHLSILWLEKFSLRRVGSEFTQTSSPSSQRFQEHYQLLVKSFWSQNLDTYQFYDLKNFLCVASGQSSPKL
jgi:hypothetical protein